MKKYLILMMFLLLTGCTVTVGHDSYIYTDYEGNEGIATDCWSSYGNMTCELNDGTKIKVVKYKGQ